MPKNQLFDRDLPTVALVWENFGPTHADRVAAATAALAGRYRVLGVELGGRSTTYAWGSVGGAFEKVTLFPGKDMRQVGLWARYRSSLRACWPATAAFLCHYEHPVTLLLAITLRLVGKRVLVMNDSKRDDYPRVWWKEGVKRVFYAPYQGALAGSPRSRDYLAELGIPRRQIHLGYDGVGVERIRYQGGRGKTAYAARNFLIVARLVPEKNLTLAFEAYARYALKVKKPRKLEICGNGPRENQLREHVARLGLQKLVKFHGFVPAAEVAKKMRLALALVLPSTREPFGQVVAEAVAVGLPVLVSRMCGACDELVRDGVNGFTFAPDDRDRLAMLMEQVGNDESAWQQLSGNCHKFCALADTSRFAAGVKALVNG